MLMATFTLPCVGEGVNLGQCISGIYTWSLTVVGLVAFVQILYAGWMWLTAFGNTSVAGAARSKITNAILGIILLFSSYLILRTINPDLVRGTVNLPKITREEQIKKPTGELAVLPNTLTRIENFDIQPRAAFLGSDTALAITLKIFASDKGIEQACRAVAPTSQISDIKNIRSRFIVYARDTRNSSNPRVVFHKDFAENFGEGGKTQSFNFTENISKTGFSGGQNFNVSFTAVFTCDNGGKNFEMNVSAPINIVIQP